MVDSNTFEKMASALTDSIAKLSALPAYAKTAAETKHEDAVKTEVIMNAVPIVINVARSLNEIALSLLNLAHQPRQ